jgi:hypothetical protein
MFAVGCSGVFHGFGGLVLFRCHCDCSSYWAAALVVVVYPMCFGGPVSFFCAVVAAGCTLYFVCCSFHRRKRFISALVAIIMLAPHVQVLAARYGPVLPCPSYLYGVVVGPGPDFLRSGFAGDNKLLASNQREYCLGTTVVPDQVAMREWIEYPLQALLHGHDPKGGWSPCRSLVVRWGPDRRPHYNKACADAEFDLVYWPLLLPPVFDVDAAVATMRKYQDVWVSGVYQYLIDLQPIMPVSQFQEVSDLLQDFMNSEH